MTRKMGSGVQGEWLSFWTLEEKKKSYHKIENWPNSGLSNINSCMFLCV